VGQYYKGKYRVRNRDKYVGDADNVVYRSSWERAAIKWLDHNPNIEYFAVEEIVVPYICETDRRVHRYFLDLWFKTTDGKTYIIEIKPKKETTPPKKPKRGSTRRYLSESLTYVKNQSKWKAATEFAKDKGWHFEIWTEDTLKGLGIKIL
jgi:hypothetical protein